MVQAWTITDPLAHFLTPPLRCADVRNSPQTGRVASGQFAFAVFRAQRLHGVLPQSTHRVHISAPEVEKKRWHALHHQASRDWVYKVNFSLFAGVIRVLLIVPGKWDTRKVERDTAVKQQHTPKGGICLYRANHILLAATDEHKHVSSATSSSCCWVENVSLCLVCVDPCIHEFISLVHTHTGLAASLMISTTNPVRQASLSLSHNASHFVSRKWADKGCGKEMQMGWKKRGEGMEDISKGGRGRCEKVTADWSLALSWWQPPDTGER